MAVDRQLLFPKSEQSAVMQRVRRQLQSAREFSAGCAYACHDMRMHLRHSARMMGVGVRNQPVVSYEADLWQQPLQLRKSSCGVVVQYSYAVATPDRLHLRHHAAALVMPVHELSERGRVIERSAVDEILHMRDEEMAGEIGLFPDWSQALQIAFCAIDAERVVGKLFDNKPALLRTVQRDRNVSLPPRQRECPRQGNKLNEQVGMSRGKPAKLAGKKVVPQSIGSADANCARDCLRRSAKMSADLKEFRFSPALVKTQPVVRRSTSWVFNSRSRAVSCRATVAWFTPKRRAAPRI
jgi:hypothetical protein